jgi:uroporphyrinogen-III synthase
LISATIAGELDAVTFTSQPAVYQLMQLAGAVSPDTVTQLQQALNTAVLTACIGPVCAEAASEEGLTAAVWPDPPRLVGLVKLVTERLAGA